MQMSSTRVHNLGFAAVGVAARALNGPLMATMAPASAESIYLPPLPQASVTDAAEAIFLAGALIEVLTAALFDLAPGKSA